MYFTVTSLNFNLCSDSQENAIVTVFHEWDNWLKRLKLTPLIRVRAKIFLAGWLYTTGFLHALAVPYGCDLLEGVTPPFSWIVATGVSCYLLLVFENLRPVVNNLPSAYWFGKRLCSFFFRRLEFNFQVKITFPSSGILKCYTCMKNIFRIYNFCGATEVVPLNYVNTACRCL